MPYRWAGEKDFRAAYFLMRERSQTQAARIEALEREARIREGEHNLRIENLTRVAETNRLRAEALEAALRRAEALSSKEDGLCLNCGQRSSHREYCPFAALREPGAGEEGK